MKSILIQIDTFQFIIKDKRGRRGMSGVRNVRCQTDISHVLIENFDFHRAPLDFPLNALLGPPH